MNMIIIIMHREYEQHLFVLAGDIQRTLHYTVMAPGTCIAHRQLSLHSRSPDNV